MAEGWIYHPDMQKAIDNNGGMHMAYFVAGLPCGTVCEVEGFVDLKPDVNYAHTNDENQVTCPACRMVNNARSTGCL
jgi:hypothetical protein